MVKKNVPELRVVFDTSVLVTEAVAELVRAEAAALIKTHSKHPDLTTRWYIPQAVLEERQYQMQERAYDCIGHVAKIEKLVGINLNLTEASLNDHVARVVTTALTENSLTPLLLDTTKVDWNRLITNATFRRPPFDGGKKEKGFRDAIILETFLQLLAESPQTPSICLVALVCGDNALVQAAKERCASASNVRIMENLEELTALINTLVSQVGEDVILEMRNRAKQYFFLPADKETFYYREKLSEQIRAKFATQLDTLPTGVDAQELTGTLISQPDFQRKVQRRFHWVTRITFNYKLFRLTQDVPSPLTGGITIGDVTFPQNPTTLSGLLNFGKRREEVGAFSKVVEVYWSASVDAKKRFSSCHIEEFKYVGGTSTQPKAAS